MKKFIFALSLILLLSSCVFAVTIGTEPPAEYMNALKDCKSGTFKTTDNALFVEYIIKGRINGKCHIQTSSHVVHNEETYNLAVSIIKSFGGDKIKDSDIPTMEEMNKQALLEKDIYACQLSDKEINDLYNAYLKHDSQNPPAKTDKDGGISISFSTDKISSYDKLLTSYYGTTCQQISE